MNGAFSGPMTRALFVLVALVGLAAADPVRLVTIASVSDDSGETEVDVRARHTATVSSALGPAVAEIEAEFQRLGLDARQLDISITRFDLTHDDARYYLTTELRVVISDGQGRMLTLQSSCATVEVSARIYRPERLERMRRDALDNASAGLADSLRARLLHERRPDA
jgi:hypothetical protein